MELQEIIPLRNSEEFSAITVTWFNRFRIKNVMISKINGNSHCNFKHNWNLIVTTRIWEGWEGGRKKSPTPLILEPEVLRRADLWWNFYFGRYDWTTGVPDNGNDWRKFRAVPRSYPLRFPCFVLRLIGLETKNVLDFQGRAGDHFHCTVERSPAHIRCRLLLPVLPF